MWVTSHQEDKHNLEKCGYLLPKNGKFETMKGSGGLKSYWQAYSVFGK